MSTKKIQIINGASIIPQADWNQTDETKADYIKNKPEKATIIDETSTDKQYPTAKLVYDYVSKYKHINIITEDVMINELNDGIYYLNLDTSATIYYGGGGEGLIDGLLFVKYDESYGRYQWVSIGLDTGWWFGVYSGITEYYAENDSYDCVYSEIETLNHRVNTISETSTTDSYPSAKAVYDYVETIKSELQGNLDEVSSLVGGAE